jgi:hypothetical protein
LKAAERWPFCMSVEYVHVGFCLQKAIF